LFYPLLLFLGDFLVGMAMVIVSQIGIGEYVNFLAILMTVIHLFSDSKTNRVHFPEKWIDLTTAIVFFFH
jgi:hypothetical protein